MSTFNGTFDNQEGQLSIEYTGTPGTSKATPSADCNCGEDRTTTVSVKTVDGSLEKQVVINQEGVREQFIPADETEGIMGSDGDYFLTIKDSVTEMPGDCTPTVTVDMSNLQDVVSQIDALGGASKQIRLVVTNESGSGNWTALENLFKEGGDLSTYNIWLDLSNLEDTPSDAFSGVLGITKLTASKGTIGASVFNVVSSLKEVIISEGATTIGTSAFYTCENLETVTIANSVTDIGGNVFVSCSNMKNLTIGSGVTYIGILAFGGCPNLKNIKFLGTEMPEIGESAFNVTSAYVCVPNDYTEDRFGALQAVKNCQ